MTPSLSLSLFLLVAVSVWFAAIAAFYWPAAESIPKSHYAAKDRLQLAGKLLSVCCCMPPLQQFAFYVRQHQQQVDALRAKWFTCQAPRDFRPDFISVGSCADAFRIVHISIATFCLACQRESQPTKRPPPLHKGSTLCSLCIRTDFVITEFSIFNFVAK